MRTAENAKGARALLVGMSHTAVLGDLEVPVTYSADEAVGLMQEEGIVGAGGAGFPTYVKYQSPPATLLVNAAESEPGYYADKLLMRDEPEALVDVFEFLKSAFSMETIIVAAETVAEPYMEELSEIARDLHNFSISYFDPKYKYGQERALCKAVMGMEIPASDFPHQHGIVVNNVETMFNMYRALFREQPSITKFLHVYGEARPLRVYEAPVGTFACDLLRLHGFEPADHPDYKLYDGGPILSDGAADPMGPEPEYVVRRTTNGLLVVHPDRDRPRNRYYPEENYNDYHNSIDAPWAPDGIINVEDRIDRVRVPLTGQFQTPGPIEVEVGQEVERGHVLAPPKLSELSIGTHASIDGTVTAITDEYVEIVRKR